ncbi:DUF2280 domain-containing protein [Pectobacterium zantedeschiae]|uniref:DUF2280 domain-containing protein n=1 Tax=Pectobacterium zantedeschiae TaxID=2034769 RepID=A0A9X8P4R8_9GAMM|nr:DUF2280 domain-containing protein [Pectobacterium zantedeschiae]RYC43707.1 DUF2280 domain-containing protein [Pectobacterium zantedeschiae]
MKPEVNAYIVQSLACFDHPSLIVDAVLKKDRRQAFCESQEGQNTK